jgi:hypothetical protein
MAKQLLTPLTVFGVRTKAEYREVHRIAMRKLRLLPKATDAKPPVLVETDAYRLKCRCGDYSLVSADWRMACCFNCGLVYEDLDIPAGEA